MELSATSLLEVFHAKTSLGLGSVAGWRASIADYGLKCSVLFAQFCRDSLSWKTSQRCLFTEWAELSETWPQSGTTQNGRAFRRQPSVPITYELASGFLPTPLASETGYRRTRYSQGGFALSTAIGGPVNPRFAEWMMGYPLEWTDLEGSETPSSPRSQK